SRWASCGTRGGWRGGQSRSMSSASSPPSRVPAMSRRFIIAQSASRAARSRSPEPGGAGQQLGHRRPGGGVDVGDTPGRIQQVVDVQKALRVVGAGERLRGYPEGPVWVVVGGTGEPVAERGD